MVHKNMKIIQKYKIYNIFIYVILDQVFIILFL